MRSEFADSFNHDDSAAVYDRDVLREENPIRAGYAATLAWVAQSAGAARRVLDLGVGTGNLAARLPETSEVVGVDVSERMLAVARDKLTADRFTWVQADLLEFFDEDRGSFDAVVSTYAIHHLTEDEKRELFARVAGVLKPGGVVVFGDLMFETAEARATQIGAYNASGQYTLVADIAEEFFWDIGNATAALRGLGLAVQTKRFSELSWGICASAQKLPQFD